MRRLIVTVALMAAAGAAPALADPAKTVQYLAQSYVIPHFRAVADATVKQEAAWTTFCSDRARGNASILREEFDHVGDAWAEIEFIRVGPAVAGLRVDRFNYWLDRRDAAGHTLDAMLASTDPKSLDETTIAGGSVAGQGMPVLERLLYDDAVLKQLKAPGDAGDRRCAVGRAIAHNLSVIADAIATDWSKPDGAGAAIAANRAWGPHFANTSQAASVMVTDLVNGIEMLKDFKVALIYHDIANPGALRLAEGSRSGRTLHDIELNFAGIHAALDAFMAPASAADKAQLEGAFADAGRKLAGVEALEKQKDPKRRLAALKSAIDSFGTLKQTAMDLIPKATGISLGFNNLDGD